MLRLQLGKISQINSILFSPDSTRIAASGDRANVRVWDLNDSEKPRILPGTQDARTLACTSDGTLCVAHYRGVDVWTSFGWGKHYSIPRESASWRLGLSDDGELLFCWNAYRTKLSCHQLPDLQQLWVTEWPSAGYQYYTYPLWDSIGRRLVLAGARKITFVDPQTGANLGDIDIEGSGHDCINVAVMQNRSSILACHVKDAIRIYDLATGAKTRQLTLPSVKPSCLAFNETGTILGCGVYPGSVLFWRTDFWSELSSFRPDISSVHSLAFSSDGCLIAAGGAQGRIAVWDAE